MFALASSPALSGAIESGGGCAPFEHERGLERRAQNIHRGIAIVPADRLDRLRLFFAAPEHLAPGNAGDIEAAQLRLLLIAAQRLERMAKTANRRLAHELVAFGALVHELPAAWRSRFVWRWWRWRR